MILSLLYINALGDAQAICCTTEQIRECHG